ncbi:MAG: glycine cleavage system protein H [Gammaproteobacteria bacterium]|nr:glycine cleavage system protein H [Gammaproteobacteria bacterium]
MACNGCEFKPDLYYDDEFQIWLSREDDGTLKVGMTDLSQSIAGKIMHIRVRKPGTQRPSGKPVATVESAKWAGPIPNFIDCVINEGNTQVLENPKLLNIDPYGSWIARVTPDLPIDEALSVFLTGKAAEEGYCQRAKDDDIHCERLE